MSLKKQELLNQINKVLVSRDLPPKIPEESQRDRTRPIAKPQPVTSPLEREEALKIEEEAPISGEQGIGTERANLTYKMAYAIGKSKGIDFKQVRLADYAESLQKEWDISGGGSVAPHEQTFLRGSGNNKLGETQPNIEVKDNGVLKAEVGYMAPQQRPEHLAEDTVINGKPSTEHVSKQEKVYLKPGEQPPQGVQPQRGEKGGMYYVATPQQAAVQAPPSQAEPAVYVPRGAEKGKYGHVPEYVNPGVHSYFFDYGDQQVKGKPIEYENLPESLYHVTTNLPAVQQSGKLIGIKGGKAGLGGNPHDQFVSFTTDPEIARQLKEDLLVANKAHNLPREQVGHYLQQVAQQQGFNWPAVVKTVEEIPKDWDAGDMLTDFFNHRETATKPRKRNPLLFGDRSVYRNLKPENVAIFKVPRNQLNPKVLTTDYDSDNPFGLNEVRFHGEVPIANENVQKMLYKPDIRKQFYPLHNDKESAIAIGDQEWTVNIADEPHELTQGLSYTESLEPQTGMFFILPEEREVSPINMQHMQYPLDIVFIADDRVSGLMRVAGVLRNVKPQQEVSYKGLPVRCFLEINAGEASTVREGQIVRFGGGYTEAKTKVSKDGQTPEANQAGELARGAVDFTDAEAALLGAINKYLARMIASKQVRKARALYQPKPQLIPSKVWIKKPDSPRGGYWQVRLVHPETGEVVEEHEFETIPREWVAKLGGMALRDRWGAAHMKQIGKVGYAVTTHNIQDIMANPEKYPDLTNDDIYGLMKFLKYRLKSTTVTFQRRFGQAWRAGMKELAKESPVTAYDPRKQQLFRQISAQMFGKSQDFTPGSFSPPQPELARILSNQNTPPMKVNGVKEQESRDLVTENKENAYWKGFDPDREDFYDLIDKALAPETERSIQDEQDAQRHYAERAKKLDTKGKGKEAAVLRHIIPEEAEHEKELKGTKIMKAHLMPEHTLPSGSKALAEQAELELWTSLRDRVDDWFEGVQPDSDPDEIMTNLKEILYQWALSEKRSMRKSVQSLFEKGFQAGVKQSGVKAGKYLKWHQGIALAIERFKTEAFNKINKIVRKHYTEDKGLGLYRTKRDVDSYLKQQRFQTRRMIRTETSKAANWGLVKAWENDDNKFMYKYIWNSVIDSGTKKISRRRHEGNPYSYPEAKFLWEHQAEKIGDKFEDDTFGQRCYLTREKTNYINKENRFQGHEYNYQRTMPEQEF